MIGFEPGRCLECLERMRQFIGVVARIPEVVERDCIRRIELGGSAEWLDCVPPARGRQSWIPCAVSDSASAVRWSWAAALPPAPPDATCSVDPSITARGGAPAASLEAGVADPGSGTAEAASESLTAGEVG